MTSEAIEIAVKFGMNTNIPQREELLLSIIPNDFISIIPYAELLAVYNEKDRELFFENLNSSFIEEVKAMVKKIDQNNVFADWICNKDLWSTDDAQTLSTLYYIGLVHDLYEFGGLIM